jgi:lysyl-tRNA synthetase class I
MTETFSETQIRTGVNLCPECGEVMTGTTQYTLAELETGTLRCQCGHEDTRPIKREIRRK